MKFRWLDRSGVKHTKIIYDYEERLKFIWWLETSPDVVTWW